MTRLPKTSRRVRCVRTDRAPGDKCVTHPPKNNRADSARGASEGSEEGELRNAADKIPLTLEQPHSLERRVFSLRNARTSLEASNTPRDLNNKQFLSNATINIYRNRESCTVISSTASKTKRVKLAFLLSITKHTTFSGKLLHKSALSSLYRGVSRT